MRVANSFTESCISQIFNPLKLYADFSGRTTRKEYWMHTLLFFVVLVILIAVDVYMLSKKSMLVPPLTMPYYLATFIPSLSLSVRRLHDVGKSGWTLLLGLLPFGGFYLLILSLRSGDVGHNQYCSVN